MDLIIHFIGVSPYIICQLNQIINFKNSPNITLTLKISLIILRFRMREGRSMRADSCVLVCQPFLVLLLFLLNNEFLIKELNILLK